MKLRYAALVLGLSALVHAGTITVNATDEPWDPTLNSSFSFLNEGATGPAVLTGLTAGEQIVITYLSGLNTTEVGVQGYVDGNGYTSVEYDSSTVTTFPADLIPTTPIFAQEVLGTFADGTGTIQGTPFAVGDGTGVLTVPAGATQLELGINDVHFSDNGDDPNNGPLFFGVTITSNGTTTTPEPGTWALVGGAILLGGILRRSKGRA